MADEPESMLAVEVWRGAEVGRFQTYRVPQRAHQTILDVVTEIQREQDANKPACEQQSANGSRDSQQQVLHQQLTDDPGSARAECRANGQFLSPLLPAGEQRAGDVDAGDQQNETD